MHRFILILTLPMLTAGCLLPDQAAERESAVVSALRPSSLPVEGPLGPVTLPRACLDPIEPSAAGLTPRTPGGCAIAMAFDAQIANPRDRVTPRNPGLPLAQPLADAANAYLGTGDASATGTVIQSPEDLEGASITTGIE